MKLAKLAFLATALAATPIAASAQDVGDTIYGNDGNPIGTVTVTDEGTVTVDTGTYKAPLPRGAIAERAINDAGDMGFRVEATKAQIDGMMEQQVAQAKAAEEARKAELAKAEAEAMAKLEEMLVVGAPIVTADEQPLGMVETIEQEGEIIVVKVEDEELISLPRTLMWVDDDGTIMARANYSDIMAAAHGG
ncbi:MAG: hypothetical protein RIB52_05580 [Erythrobacter sp.]|uniref:hypothetical protein n=1 Tax=Erythrobacter sp. TaxID=1042 RepID=UPI0032ED4309